MRKFFFFLILAMGPGIGLLISIASNDKWGLAVLMMGLGLMISAPLAAALTGIGRSEGRSGRGWGNGGSGASGPLFKGDSPLRRWDR